jgi:hypothetical protein
VSKSLWTDSIGRTDPHELRLILDHRIGQPGQYGGSDAPSTRFYLPLAGTACEVVLIFSNDAIVGLETGPAFDESKWNDVLNDISALQSPPIRQIARQYSFCSFRVNGYWTGRRSLVQILPPPDDAPRADVEIADHPFILEYPFDVTGISPVDDDRRLRQHRRIANVLNVLLRCRISVPSRQSEHLWASVRRHDGSTSDVRWVQRFFFSKLGRIQVDQLSVPEVEQLERIDSDTYYGGLHGHDGKPLRVPDDLDDSIVLYHSLSPSRRDMFDRAAYWFELASRLWATSISLSFTALVSCIEAFLKRGEIHNITCSACGKPTQHEAPGATERFRSFVEQFAPGTALRKRRNEMYRLRSEILHGSRLMLFDEWRNVGWDPPYWNQRELHAELWTLTETVLRNWLKQTS